MNDDNLKVIVAITFIIIITMMLYCVLASERTERLEQQTQYNQYVENDNKNDSKNDSRRRRKIVKAIVIKRHLFKP